MAEPHNPQPGLSHQDLQHHQLTLQSEEVTPISKIVGDIHRKKEEEQAQRLAKQLSLPYLNLMNYQPAPGVVGIVPKELVETGHIFAFKKQANNVYLAISDFQSPQTVAALEQMATLEQYNFIPVLVSPSSMSYLAAMYDTLAPTVTSHEDVRIDNTTQITSTASMKDWVAMGEQASHLPVSELFSVIVANATQMDASDIHIEPTQTATHLRFRVDGILQDIVDLPSSVAPKLISRIKLLAGLKLNVKKSAQDGRFSLDATTTTYDVRVSVLPSAYGESAVLRLLPQTGQFISLTDLGLIGHNAKIVDTIIKQPNGLILATGPTGSGKTTTLYAILDEVNQPGKKIITIEDPVEYRLKGITQSQVNPDEGYSFATGLKSILRQDPDVVLVGEIRDHETADIAVNASLTGHLVLSTLHTNDAAGAIPRLADLGLEPKYFIEAILAIVAQRLVRRLCAECAKDYALDATTIQELQSELGTSVSVPKTLKQAVGCDKCNGTGYKGRLGIFEILKPNDEIIKAVLAGSTINDIRTLAIKAGMITLRQDGLQKALDGLTTIEEVERVTKEE